MEGQNWRQVGTEHSYQHRSDFFAPTWKNFVLYAFRQIARVKIQINNNQNMRNNAQRKFRNELSIARASRGLSRKNVARVLGYKRTCPLSHFERGQRLPSLKTALRLEILYR